MVSHAFIVECFSCCTIFLVSYINIHKSVPKCTAVQCWCFCLKIKKSEAVKTILYFSSFPGNDRILKLVQFCSLLPQSVEEQQRSSPSNTCLVWAMTDRRPNSNNSSSNETQGSHRNRIIKFHYIFMTIYAVFHDVRKADTEDHCAYSSYILYIRKESQISFQTENKESKRWFASCLRLRFWI